MKPNLPLVALIMAGGRGERFWPKSRISHPKQFLKIIEDKTMLQMTVERINPLVPIEHVFVATGADYFNLAREQLQFLPEENIIVEPVSKDTAPCIGFATLYIERKFPEAIMLVLPADHVVLNKSAYLNCVSVAVELAYEEDSTVTLGIKPNRPEIGYGYIQLGEMLDGTRGIYRVGSFKEKPDRIRAEGFFSSGEYFWNSGMFIWRLSTIKKLISQFMPEISKRLVCIQASIGTACEKEVVQREFCQMPKISIDCGVLEKAEKVYVIIDDFGWDDLGGWPALARVLECDYHGNLSTSNHLGLDTSNCIIEGNGKLISTIGVKDIIIVATDDVVLVCSRERAQEIKKVINELRQKELFKYL